MKERRDRYAVGLLLFVGIAAIFIFVNREDSSAKPLSAIQSIQIGAAMPASIDVMGVAWRVESVRFADEGMQGLTQCDKHVILISATGIHRRQTLIHELLHAAVCHFDAKENDFQPANLWYNSKTQDGHEGFNHIAGVISELLARNPQLAEYEADSAEISVATVSVK